MNIYILRPDSNHYKNIIFKNEKDWDLLDAFDGKPLEFEWPTVKICYVQDNDEDLPVGDFPSLASHVPVFQGNALKILQNILTGKGELLPLILEGSNYFALNVTTVVDVLDLNRSGIISFDDGRILEIEMHHFKEEIDSGITIFKIPHAPLMNVYVTDNFKDAIDRSNLRGFEFVKVWKN